MIKAALTTASILLLASCSSIPKWSEGPGNCAYETGQFEEGWGKDVYTGVRKYYTSNIICVEQPEVVKLPAYIELLNLPPAKSKPVVAVYNFLDKTGQRKDVGQGQSFST